MNKNVCILLTPSRLLTLVFDSLTKCVCPLFIEESINRLIVVGI